MMGVDTLLVREAREMLSRAAAGGGCIYHTRSSGTPSENIVVDDTELIPSAADHRVVASWLGALEDLLGYGYIRRMSGGPNRREFRVTSDGYAALEELAERGR